MNIKNKSLIAAGVLAAALGASAGVFAEAQGPGAPPPPAGAQAGQRGQRAPVDPAEMQKRMDERRAQQTQRVHDLLQITPAQEGAFKAWQDSMKPPALKTQAERQAQRDKVAAMNTTQRLDERLARTTEMLTAQKTRIEATKRFYAQLSPAQKKSFDALQQGGRDRMRGDRGRGGAGMRGGMMRGPGGPGGGPGGPGPR